MAVASADAPGSRVPVIPPDPLQMPHVPMAVSKAAKASVSGAGATTASPPDADPDPPSPAERFRPAGTPMVAMVPRQSDSAPLWSRRRCCTRKYWGAGIRIGITESAWTVRPAAPRADFVHAESLAATR